MSPQQDTFSEHAEIVQWLSKRSGYTSPEEMVDLTAAMEPFEFDDDEEDDFDWE